MTKRTKLDLTPEQIHTRNVQAGHLALSLHEALVKADLMPVQRDEPRGALDERVRTVLGLVLRGGGMYECHDWIGETLMLRKALARTAGTEGELIGTKYALEQMTEERNTSRDHFEALRDWVLSRTPQDLPTPQCLKDHLADVPEPSPETTPANGYIVLNNHGEPAIYSTLDDVLGDWAGEEEHLGSTCPIYELGRRMRPTVTTTWEADAAADADE